MYEDYVKKSHNYDDYMYRSQSHQTKRKSNKEEFKVNFSILIILKD